MLNYFSAFSIILSGGFYLFFKMRQFRTTYVLPIRKKMFASIAGVFLGSLLFFFGINQLVLFDKAVTYIVSAIFILLGLSVIIFNYRAYAHYKKFVEEEMELNKS